MLQLLRAELVLNVLYEVHDRFPLLLLLLLGISSFPLVRLDHMNNTHVLSIVHYC